LWLAGRPVWAAAFFAAAGVVCLVVAWWRNRLLDTESLLEYQDAGDPVVRTLELSA